MFKTGSGAETQRHLSWFAFRLIRLMGFAFCQGDCWEDWGEGLSSGESPAESTGRQTLEDNLPVKVNWGFPQQQLRANCVFKTTVCALIYEFTNVVLKRARSVGVKGVSSFVWVWNTPSKINKWLNLWTPVLCLRETARHTTKIHAFTCCDRELKLLRLLWWLWELCTLRADCSLWTLRRSNSSPYISPRRR